MKRYGLPHLIDLGGVETLGGKKFSGTICSVDFEANRIARVTAQTDVVQQCRGKEQGLIDLLGQVQVVAEHTGEDPASSTVISHGAALLGEHQFDCVRGPRHVRRLRARHYGWSLS